MPASTLRRISLLGFFFVGTSSNSLPPNIRHGSDSFSELAHLASFSSSVNALNASPFFLDDSFRQNF